MTREHFNEAFEIISRHSSTTVHINAKLNHFVGGIGSTDFLMHITKCAPSLVNDFVKHGYLLSMSSEGLRVDKI